MHFSEVLGLNQAAKGRNFSHQYSVISKKINCLIAGDSSETAVGVHGPGRLRRCQRQVNFSVFFSWQFHIDKTATAGVGRCSLVTLKFLYIKLTGFAGI